MDYQLLQDIVLIIGLSVAAVYVCRRLRIPGIVGFLVTGAAAGPGGFGLIASSEDGALLTEIGVVALLFTIGLEFSLAQLWRIRQQIIVGGTLQVFTTATVVALLAMQFGQSLNDAIVVGCLVALSSTAVVLSLLQQRGEMDSPQGRISLALLIYQDLIVVGMLLMVPLLAGESEGVGGALLWLALKTVLVGASVVVLSRWVVPAVLGSITRTGERDLFVLSIVFITLSIAWMTSLLGLSLALGAFLAGLIISESEHSHRALGSILPFRDVFTSFFFISIGMMLDVGYVAGALPLIAGTTLGVILLKSALICATVLVLGYPLRIAIIAGLTIAQVGEFSFLIFQVAVAEEMLNEGLRQLFLAVSVITMMLTPALIAFAPRIGEAAAKVSWLRFLTRTGEMPMHEDINKMEDHLIIAGFGFSGQNLAKAALTAGIDYVVIELNPETAQRYANEGESIFCGDATYAPVLQHAGIERASVLAVVMSDAAGTRRTVEEAARLNPACHIIARAQFAGELSDVISLGANEVVAEEFEASIEIFARVMRAFLVAPDRVDEVIAQVRADGYALFSAEGRAGPREHGPSHLPNWQHDVSALRVCEQSPLAGKTLEELRLRSEYGLTLIAVQREGQAVPNPPADFRIEVGDIAIVMGDRSTLAEFSAACRIT